MTASEPEGRDDDVRITQGGATDGSADRAACLAPQVSKVGPGHAGGRIVVGVDGTFGSLAAVR